MSGVIHHIGKKVSRSIQSVLWKGGNAFQSLFDVFVYQTESIVSTMPNIRLNTIVWNNVAGYQHLNMLAAC